MNQNANPVIEHNTQPTTVQGRANKLTSGDVPGCVSPTFYFSYERREIDKKILTAMAIYKSIYCS